MNLKLFSDIHFQSPQMFHLFWLVLLTVFICWLLERMGAYKFDQFISRVMQARLVGRLPAWRRLTSLLLLGLAAICLVIALMRPQWGLRVIESPQVGAQLMICVDVSKSMLAEDVAPNRLERAKAEIRDLLPYLDGDHVGLIAFAGKATVSSPMTPDFGFFRLVLDNLGTGSVPLGGTNLEAPLREAIDGFKMEADAARAILLVTDGEDHDSFPLEAAKAAQERGIRVIAIGFGDETGSPIWITDPDSGARKKLLDGSGQPVNSRLDGDLLREIALTTQGVYIPAGTGVLDLKSIYDAHLKPLTRSSMTSKRQTIRQEAYHWFIMGGMLLFILAAMIRSLRPNLPVTACLLMAFIQIPEYAMASTNSAKAPTPEATPEASPEASSGTNSLPKEEAEKGKQKQIDASDQASHKTPRELFNEGLAFYESGNYDSAENRYQNARREAQSDGELRYRTSFNLAWVEIKRGEAVLTGEKKEPEVALQHLRRAADWFRDAIRLRPDDKAPRQNLELLQRRILQLTDAMKQKQGDLTSRLDEMIRRLREEMPPVISLLENMRVKSHMDERLRQSFRAAATQQRVYNSDLKSVMDQAWEEKNALSGKQDINPEEQFKVAQLTQLHQQLSLASQKLAQARTQLRLRQAERAYYRKSAGLDYLLAARDQLRDPVQRLQAISQDQSTLLSQTQLLARDQFVKQALTQDQQVASTEVPGWMTFEYLSQTQEALVARAAQLKEILAQAEAQLQAQQKQEKQAQDSQNPQAPQTQDPQQQRFLKAMRDATPYIKTAVEQLNLSHESLVEAKGGAALSAQKQAMLALTEAMMFFMDIKQLIEFIYQDEKRLEQFYKESAQLDSKESSKRDLANDFNQRVTDIQTILPSLEDLQSKNLDRLLRLRELLKEAQNKLEAQQASGSQPNQFNPANPQPTPNPNPNSDPNADAATQNQQQIQQVTLAIQLVDAIDKDINQVLKNFEAFKSGPVQENQIDLTARSLAQSNEKIVALRRLFFTIIQHLQEALREQLEINDQTQTIFTLNGKPATSAQNLQDQLMQKLGPVTAQQQQLIKLTDEITEGLKKMAASTAQGPAAQAPNGQAPAMPQTSPANEGENLIKASEKTKEAAGHMNAVLEQFATLTKSQSQDGTANENSQKEQVMAAQKLAEALKLLQSQNQQNDPQSNQQNQQQNNQSQNKQQEQNQEQPQGQGQGMDHVLQGVRDREAKRRRDKQRGLAPAGTVEKDW